MTRSEWLYDRLKDTKFERPSPVKVGGAHPVIEKWEEHSGFKYVTRSKPPRRTKPPELEGLEYSWSDFEKQIVDQILKIKSRPRAMREADRIARQVSLDDLGDISEEYLKNREKLTKWEFREIARCIEGHGSMTGLHYFYYNYCWITETTAGGGGGESIQPDYRRADASITNYP